MEVTHILQEELFRLSTSLYLVLVFSNMSTPNLGTLYCPLNIRINLSSKPKCTQKFEPKQKLQSWICTRVLERAPTSCYLSSFKAIFARSLPWTRLTLCTSVACPRHFLPCSRHPSRNSLLALTKPLTKVPNNKCSCLIAHPSSSSGPL